MDVIPSQQQNDIVSYKRLVSIIFWVIPLVLGFVSLRLGRDINWDLKNYHYYNAYAFLENRLDFDIAPAQVQTYINPLGDLPFYWLTQNFHSSIAGFVLGWVHGFNLSFLFLIFLRIAKFQSYRKKIIFGLCLVAFSGIAPAFISELGNTMHDNLTSVFVLASLFLVMSSLSVLDTYPKYVQLGLAGFIMGLGVGIKPSITIFAISIAIALIISHKKWRDKVITLFLYGLFGITGGLITTGFWWWNLWQRFGNPFFPFYNHIFQSPYFTTLPVTWSRFIPESFWEYLTWPLIFSANSLRVNQYEFFDIRFALLYLLFLIWLIVFSFKKVFMPHLKEFQKPNFFEVHSSNFLLIFFLISYVLWIRESATYRFMIPLELLAPLCFLIILERLISNGKFKYLIILGCAILTLVVFKPFNWGRLEWTNSYFSLDTSLLTDTNEPIVIMLGDSPTSYVIPHFPQQYRFVRPDGNIRLNNSKEIKFILDIQDLLKNHKGNFYLLYNKKERDIPTQDILLSLGLEYSIEDCFLLKLNTPDQIEFCHLLNFK